MYLYSTSVRCPQTKIGTTLVISTNTKDKARSRHLIIGSLCTIRLNWLQPHEGNIVDFLFRARAF